ncbi:ROK family protein [Clostridium sp. NSJ-49]|uniref:Transcriptional regulator/sugar kinase n=1 Tax=Clostridium disporicum TaxID=84024 RepID=A0A174M4G2_9CLOT|nr:MULTISPECIES: ROK family protein [Clostridium]MBC5624111.1 ROK family protein [Clostridium sp. NSJ-49]MCD2503004.1 ROK family protein [Clostridium sp. NSJ-145]CUP28905.1 transcriptional regulator/sugar kinase [Clostridium disporicum]
MEKKYVVGVDLGGTKIYTALVDLEGNIINEKIVETLAEEGEEAVAGRIINTIDSVIAGVDKDLIKAIGIGSPGPLDAKKGIIIETSNLPFKNFEIVNVLKERYDLPTYLDNDANVATLAEFMFGAGKGTENMVYITVSTGIGGGAIINGKLYRGNTANALEVGHMTVSKEGPRCGCGNVGCAESFASGTAIGKRAKEAVASKVVTSLKKYNNVTAKEVFIEAAEGDAEAKRILDSALYYLGITVGNVMSHLDPEKVVMGGGVINGGDIVLETVKKVVAERCLSVFAENCSIEKAKLGGQAGVLGAAALAITEK